MAATPADASRLLGRAVANDRLAHAYLFSGSEPLAVARSLAATLLGVEEAQLDSHPDGHFIQPESKSRRIVVEQIRDVEHALHQKARVGGRKVAIITDADRMQPQAANAFLKTLEEPPDRTHLLLVSQQPEMLLDTIVSRCIGITLHSGRADVRVNDRVLEALRPICEKLPAPTVADAFVFTRRFQQILNDLRESIRGEAEAETSSEKKRMRETVDATWLAQREEQAKARAEAAVLRERGILLQSLAAVFVEALRTQSGKPGTARRDLDAMASLVAERLTIGELVRRIDAIDRLASSLERNVNEALALEAGFLEIFCRKS